jgi:hypothetical protein
MQLEQRARGVFFGSANEMSRSLIDGSSLTGAPGQPVEDGNLITSFVPAYPTADTFEVTTNAAYAPAVENAVGSQGQPVTYGKKRGGSHSRKLTEAGMPNIFEKVTRDVTGGDAQ